jgi:hypothetical protein
MPEVVIMKRVRERKRERWGKTGTQDKINANRKAELWGENEQSPSSLFCCIFLQDFLSGQLLASGGKWRGLRRRYKGKLAAFCFAVGPGA